MAHTNRFRFRQGERLALMAAPANGTCAHEECAKVTSFARFDRSEKNMIISNAKVRDRMAERVWGVPCSEVQFRCELTVSTWVGESVWAMLAMSNAHRSWSHCWQTLGPLYLSLFVLNRFFFWFQLSARLVSASKIQINIVLSTDRARERERARE